MDLSRIAALLTGDPKSARVVPPTGFTATLTTLTSAAMAVLAVFAIALSLASGRLAERWATALTDTATIRIAAPAEQLDAQTTAVLRALDSTPGVTEARAMTAEETAALLEPWIGPNLPVDALPIPRLVELRTGAGFDGEALRLRLAGEAPGAVLDDHLRWRAPFVAAAGWLRTFGIGALVLIAAATAAMITLAAQAALSANAQVIRTLRLVGAEDRYIAGAFVRRFTLRAFGGALAGAVLAMLCLALLPSAGDGQAGFLAGLGLRGGDWLWPVAVPPLAALVALVATRIAAFRRLREVQ
ncbi:MAG: hypothetical protein RLZZ528_1851 [Pseudomonadota bacterium]|jgi:cell division transport system permease protein